LKILRAKPFPIATICWHVILDSMTKEEYLIVFGVEIKSITVTIERYRRAQSSPSAVKLKS